MKHLFNFLLIGSFLILLTACPYRSKFALSELKNSEIDSLLIGTWVGKNIKDTADMGEVKISKLNNNQLQIELRSYDQNDKAEQWTGFITIVGNQKIINLLGKEDSYTFIKYSTDGKTLKASLASDNFIQQAFTSQKELLDFFTANINKKDLFEGSMVFKKKGNKK